MHYVPPLHLQPVYEALGLRDGDLPVTERVLSLPIRPQLTEPQIDWVCRALKRAIV